MVLRRGFIMTMPSLRKKISNVQFILTSQGHRKKKNRLGPNFLEGRK